MPTMTAYNFGDVMLVPFPFSDQTTTKQRPAVVISSTAYHQARPDVILLAVTSQVRASLGVGEIPDQNRSRLTLSMRAHSIDE
jgi:mRNA interferase MazF